jgi:cytochrome c oxidase assembly protein subunit 11
MVGQAVPSVSPFRGADFLHKTECFCFTQQQLEAGEEIEMPLLFFIDKALPDDVNKLTLSYTLFDVSANFVNTCSALSAN